MSKTVAVISDTGRLVNASGVDKESDSRYSKFAKRLLGDSSGTATLDFGWNGGNSLSIAKSSGTGQHITLTANEIRMVGTLKVNGSTIQDVIDGRVPITTVQGTTGQIAVTSSGKTRTISLDTTFLGRMSTVETTLDQLFAIEGAYKAGDGIQLTDSGNVHHFSVKAGVGLKFAELGPGETRKSLTLDMDSTPTQFSVKPVTSGGVYEAIQAISGSQFVVNINSNGNYAIFNTQS